MNSQQKQAPSKIQTKNTDVIFNFENKLASMSEFKEVDLLMKKLQFLGLHFDPFSGEVSAECVQILDELSLKESLTNPYESTNILL